MVWLLLEDNKSFGNKKTWTGPHFVSLQDGILFVFKINSTVPKGTIDVASPQTTFDSQPNVHGNGKCHFFSINFNSDTSTGMCNRTVFLSTYSPDSKERWLESLSLTKESSVAAPPAEPSEKKPPPHVMKEGILLCSPTQKLTNGKGSPANGDVVAHQAPMGGDPRGGGDTKPSKALRVNHSWSMRFFKLLNNGQFQFFDVSAICSISLLNAQILIEQDPVPSCVGTDWNIHTFTINSDSLAMASNSMFDRPKQQLGRMMKRANLHSVTFGSRSKDLRDSIAERVKEYGEWCQHEDAKQRRLIHDATQVVAKAWMFKKGPKAFSRWKRRFFVYLSTREVVYYENDLNGKVKGSIDLSAVAEHDIRIRSDVKDAPAPHVLEVVTNKRSWYLCPGDMGDEDLRKWQTLLRNKDTFYERYHDQISASHDASQFLYAGGPDLETASHDDNASHSSDLTISEDDDSGEKEPPVQQLDSDLAPDDATGACSPQSSDPSPRDAQAVSQHADASRAPPSAAASGDEMLTTAAAADKAQGAASSPPKRDLTRRYLNPNSPPSLSIVEDDNLSPRHFPPTRTDIATASGRGETAVTRPSIGTRSQSSSDPKDGLHVDDSTSPSGAKVLGRSNWQVISGNTPVECLSLSPYSAKVLAESLTGIPTPRRSIVNHDLFDHANAEAGKDAQLSVGNSIMKLSRPSFNVKSISSGSGIRLHRRSRSSLPSMTSMFSPMNAFGSKGATSPKNESTEASKS